MILTIFLISPLFAQLQKQCAVYPPNPNICIDQTSDYSCAFDLKQNACIYIKSTNDGCALNLNKKACLNQLRDKKGKECLCVFDTRCKNASATQLSKLGCFERFSKYACMNVRNKKCLWYSSCQEITIEQNDDQECEKQYGLSVTPFACSTLKNLKCMNGGIEEDYQCRTVKEQEYYSLKCSQLGLTEMACLSIETAGEQCIYKSNVCQSIVQINEIQNCKLKINKLACLSINKPNLACFWNNNNCQDFIQSNQILDDIVENVNINVCAKLKGSYEYIKEKYQCIKISEVKLQKLSCNTFGLSKEVCLQIKSYNCSFYKGYCQELNEFDLQTYQCIMELNELACINIKTQLQYCKWNGNSCERIFMNQDIDCPLNLEDEFIKVNGNVCKAISKSDVKCKYNPKTNLCVTTSENDSCDTPFINFFGCVSIYNNKQKCQWINSGCVYANIELGQTTCNSLGHANPYSCSQVHENIQIGCYYDKNQQKCVSVNVEQDDNQIKTFLNTISCKDLSLGINNVLCASITTEQTPCIWFQDQCTFAIKRNINQVPCHALVYANYQACSLVEYEKTFCVYSSKNSFKGCIDFSPNKDKIETQCDIKGLNKYACSIIQNNCYFENNQCKTVQQDYRKLKCNSDSPSQKVCLSIQTEGELCRWSDRIFRCINVTIYPNQSCLDLTNVNINVCKQILMSFPDYDPINPNQEVNRGYCYYNETENKCQTLDDRFSCTTKCCTEVPGINVHSCSRYSSTQIGDYCFFYNGKCQELTPNFADITNPKQVQNYYNEMKLKCSSMTKNSCHMINWSIRERCIYDGKICNNFDQKYYPDLQLLIIEPFILNKSACLSVEATLTQINKVKYLTYDEQNKRCKDLEIKSPITKCEDAEGNRNVCLRYTENIYCKWDYDNLKCVTISQNEFENMKTCDLSQNIKACNENKYQNCYFNYDSDVCLKASPDQKCGDLKNISELVCKQLKNEPCQYTLDNENQKYICSMAQNTYNECNNTGINNKACYGLTKKECRWNEQKSICYENQQDISNLGCQDNLNRHLCLQITKEPCVWNTKANQCERFFQMSHIQFFTLEPSNQYNQLACLQINEEGYRYNKDIQKCEWIKSEYQLSCSELNINKYACLFQTRGSKCYYENGLCKDFKFDQTKCESNLDINIEVCLDIPQTCFFNVNSLKCENAVIYPNTGCQSLFVSPFDQFEDKYPDGISKQKQNGKEKRYYNKLSCSSISADQTSDYGEEQCSMSSDKSQQCNQQKYCFWDITTYNCNVLKFLQTIFDERHHYQTNKTMLVLNETKDLEYVEMDKNCSSQIIGNDIKQQIKYKRCKKTDLPCEGDLECSPFTNQTFEQIGNITELEILIKNLKPDEDEKCVEYCLPADYNCEQNTTQKLKFDNNKEKICASKTFYQKQSLCYLFKTKISKCDNIYSKAICLEMIEEKCYFDIKQGGCRQFEGNEHKLPSCSAIQKECYQSYSKAAICQLKEIDKKNNKCITYIEKEQICISYQLKEKVDYCQDIKIENVQPVLCAQAQDNCRFDDIKKKCVTVTTLPNSCNCDKSYSQLLCKSCGCDYTFLGYCQQQKLVPQITIDKKNKYYLCYEVNLLDLKYRQEICSKVAQACIFQKNNCEDATHLNCKDLTDIISSELACLRCKDLPMMYSKEQQKCLELNTSNNVIKCESLNQQACREITSISCLWKDDSCRDQLSETEDCQFLNYPECIKERNQQNLCWFNTQTKLCMKFNPKTGKCDSLKNKQSCNLTMVESCVWDGKECKIASFEPKQCEGLNKFGCLNLKDKPCVWSDINLTCRQTQFLDKPISCTQFLQDSQNDVSHMNAQTCTEIEVEKSCILGLNNICREILEPNEYECEFQGLNRWACLYKTINLCMFSTENHCIPIFSRDEVCSVNLNKLACLNQKQKCQYKNNQCQAFEFTDLNDLFLKDTQYSSQLCKYYDSETSFSMSLVYSQDKKRCEEIKEGTIPNCGTQGINKFACLSKTEGLCQYNNSECQNIQEIKFCDDNLNQMACLASHKIQCKFKGSKCQSLNDQETCEDLQKEESKVHFIVCAKTKDMPCKYNSSKQSCEVINLDEDEEDKQDETCSTLGLNEKACIFNTPNSKCKFDQNQCKSDYEIALCTDKINLNKCLTLQRQYCYFHQSYGCKEIDESIDTKTCLSDIEKSAFTCSLATDQPCFFNQFNQKCGLAQLNDENFFLQNKLSFNQKACLQFQDAKTYWKDGSICQDATEELLYKLKCNDQLNKNACLNVKTQSQFCQFKDGKCQTYNQQKEECQNIIDINNGILCSLDETEGKNCKYNSQKYMCEQFEPIQNSNNLSCGERALQFYNKNACEINQNCIFINECIELDHNKIYYCIQGASVDQCKQVLQQGCYIQNQQSKCSLITPELSKNLTCTQVQNKVGCIQLQTKEQYCRYYNNNCYSENILEYKNKKCIEITQINNYKFCEQIKDIPCVYDPISNSCIQAKQESQDLTCPRGLNKKACIPTNSNSKQCQFFKYCYGKNSEILNCKSDEKECCKLALTQESCLFQTMFKCQWKDNSCSQYIVQSNGIQCDQIKNASRNVCYSFFDKFCIFDDIQLKCIEVVPQNCDQVQSAQQCRRIPKIPCSWYEDECQFKQKNIADSCEDITQQSGNQQACIQVEKNGQMCAFIDQKCQTFKEIKDENNCLDYINRNACLKQTQSECYWESKVPNIQINSYSDQIQMEIGICEIYSPENQIESEKNLSHAACLKSKKKGIYYFWQNDQCQKPKNLNFKFIDLSLLGPTNSNCCKLITDVPVIYDEIKKQCDEIDEPKNLSCNPPNPGMNRNACQSIQPNYCKWNEDEKICYQPQISNANSKNNVIRNKESNKQTCQQNGMNPIHCSKLYLELPCGGSLTGGCDEVDLNKVKCDHIGLNKYACMNVKTQPCIWTQNEENEFYHCEERIPDGKCEEYNQIVNAVLCSMVEQNDPCTYDSLMNTCKKPDENYNNCNVLGINAYGCMKIKNCFFQNHTCKLFDQNLNLSCKDVQFANKLVCSQVRNEGCKYDQLQSGCIESQFDDLCSTSEINMNGCNQIENCQWKDQKCQCKKLLEKYQDCSLYKDYWSCTNSGRCYFDYSLLLNEGICQELECSDLKDKCNIQIENGKACYQNLNGQCIEANSCDEIKNFNLDCSKYSFNNIQCVNDGNNGCIQFEMCEKLNYIECNKQNNCIFFNTCLNKSCYQIVKQDDCISFNCSWSNKQCVEQINCSDFQSEKECNINQYNGKQCSWYYAETDIQFCSSDSCSYLKKDLCHGAQINPTVCIQLSNLICLSCEQITDACECISQNDYCHYDTQKHQCISQQCEFYNQVTCPKNRCLFTENTQICSLQCQYRYNKKQCEQQKLCIWNDLISPPCFDMPFYQNNADDSYFDVSALLLQISLFLFTMILI